MPKVGIVDIKPDFNKLQPDALSQAGMFSPAGIKTFKDIIEGIRAMIKEAKELQNPNQNPDMVNPNAVQPIGITQEQVFKFGRQFLDNLIKQGYGDKTASEVLAEIPFTVKQLRGFLK